MTMTAGMTVPTRDRSPRRGDHTAVAAVVGLLLAGRALWDIAGEVQYAAFGVATEARLVGIIHVADGPGRMSHYARVRYVAGGKPLIVVSENRIGPARHEIGDVLPVTYLSAWPQRVRLADGAGALDRGTWLSLGLSVVAGLWGSGIRDRVSGIRKRPPGDP